MTLPDIPPTFHGSAHAGEPWIGYIRVSTWKEEKISPELQRTAIEQWAARTGRRIVDWIVDLDESGRHFKRKIMGGIERIERREVRGIAVWRYSRFGRNRTGNAANLARVEAAGGLLESATEPVDASTAIGRFARGMYMEFAAFESDRAGEQWKETHEHRLAAKLPATGRGRFGYIWHRRAVPDATAPNGIRLQQERYTLHPDYASVVEELYERKTEEYEGFNALAHWLNEELVIPTLRGKAWGVSSVSRYLDSGFAAGLLRTHDKTCPCGYSSGKRSGCPDNRFIYLPGAQPRIITPDQWEAYKEHRKTTKATPPRARKATYPLTGLLRHGYCRHHMSAASYTYKGEQMRGRNLVCSRNKHTSKVECPKGINTRRDYVEREVKKWLEREAAPGIDASPRLPVQRTEPTEDPRARAQRERARLQVDLTKVEKALDRLVMDNALNPEKYPADSFARVRDQLAGQRGSIMNAMNELGEVEATPTREEFVPLIANLIEAWDLMEPIEKNALLRQIVRRIVCHDIRTEGSRWIEVRVEVHPVYEPDPWAPIAGEVVARKDEPAEVDDRADGETLF
ncbi:serine integrase [Streptomyces phage Raleigh]|uniref:Serine integrase n=1 Tax=Streptomyces phage Raleigh TaxID=1920312 RepID=A0A1J0MCY2_9CAUD|nr:recombinase family protein [Streptomyces sp. MMBL 11-1]YP_009788288.1 integrase [Streptomyces phage Raleigh]APD18778.1 serine integrase [Streptomyces phage Raleigh]